MTEYMLTINMALSTCPSINYFWLHGLYSRGHCKSWTLDSGLDYGLDHGLDYGLDHGLDHGLDYGLNSGPPCTLNFFLNQVKMTKFKNTVKNSL